MKTKIPLFHLVFFVCLLFFAIQLQGQNNLPYPKIPLAIKLMAVCNNITSNESDPIKLMKFLFTDSTTSFKNTSVINKFNGDSSFAFFKNNSVVQVDRFFTRTTPNIPVFQLFIDPNSSYLINNKKQIIFDTLNVSDNISYPELIACFGNPISDYLPEMQPKDTKHYHFIYTNPQTQKGMIIKIISLNSPNVKNNTIYRITASEKMLDLPFNFSKFEPAKGKPK